MWIKEITVENYKSFGDEVTIPLRSFNVLVGPNNSGKSNFFDLLSFLSKLVEHGDPVSCLDGEYEEIIFNEEVGRNLQVRIKVKEPEGEYLLEFDEEGNIEEWLKPRGEKRLIKTPSDKKRKFWSQDEESFQEEAREYYASIRREGDYLHPFHNTLHDFLDGIKVYKFIPSKLTNKQEIKGETSLGETGENLSQVIHFIRNKDRKRYRELENLLIESIPEIERLETPPDPDGNAELEIVEENLEKRIKLSEMSDGIRWLLAHLCFLSSWNPPSVACFEEPGRSIHPRLLEILVNAFKATDIQILATTHDPFFVNKVDPEDLIIFEKREGKTQIRTIEEPEKMKERTIKDIPLGELWYSGEIGGV